MEGKSLEERVTLLENELRELPERVETQVTAVVVQVAQFRDEVRDKFEERDDETRRLMRVLHEDLVERISLIDHG